jgi:hypothetical protein
MGKQSSGEDASVIAQLRKHIQNCGQSLQQLGRESGVSAGQLSRFLRAERQLNSGAIDKICRLLRLQLVSQAEAPPAKKGGKRK